MNGFLEFFRKLGAGRLIAMGIVSAGLLAFFSYLVLQFTAQPMSLLFSNLDMNDSGEIIAKLESMDIPYQLQGDGGTILVPRDEARRLRMLLAEQNLPSGGSVGYEIFDKSEILGQTSFAQNINQLRAMEGELARTIQSISTIVHARVHLVIPKRELFSGDKKQEPTASIVIKSRGTATDAQVSAIQHLVASAVPGMSPSRVAVIDNKGKLLARGVDDEIKSGSLENLRNKNLEYEALISDRIQSMVGSIVGMENVRVQTSAQLNMESVTENSEIFDPNGRVIRSTNIMEEESEHYREDSEKVSVAGSLPEAEADKPAVPDNKLRDNRSEETSNYEISRTTRVKNKEAGAIEKLSIAVLVNGAITVKPDGSKEYSPRSEEEIRQIETLVKAAIGYDEKRGDQVSVSNLRFSESEIPAEEPSETPFLGIENAEWIRFAQTGVLGLVALLTALFVFRPLITRLLEITPVTSAQMQTALAGPGQPPQITGPAAQQGQSAQAMLEGPNETRQIRQGINPQELENLIDVAKIEGQVKASSVKKVGEVINRHPDEAISILRSWLHDKE